MQGLKQYWNFKDSEVAWNWQLNQSFLWIFKDSKRLHWQKIFICIFKKNSVLFLNILSDIDVLADMINKLSRIAKILIDSREFCCAL